MPEAWWTANNHRVDWPDLHVAHEGQGWVIMQGNIVVARTCACCGRQMHTERAAKLVCEMQYPPRRAS